LTGRAHQLDKRLGETHRQPQITADRRIAKAGSV
jgi:hypothetical protein